MSSRTTQTRNAQPTLARLAAIGASIALVGLLVLAAPVASGAPPVVGGPPPGAGGGVQNTSPVVGQLAADAAQLENDGLGAIVLRGSVRDPNGEQDLTSLRFALSGAASSSNLRIIVKADNDAADEPVAFGTDGWKVWTGADRRDGVLQFAYRYPVAAFAAAGTYGWNLTVTDQKGNTGHGQAAVLVTKFAQVTLHAKPVQASGADAVDSTWGGWNATPGQTNVVSTSFLKVTNTGAKPDAQAVLDFNEASFVGQDDAGFSVPINGNLQFAVWEDTTPATSSPSEGTFVFQDAAAHGSVTVKFTGAANVLYVQYRIAAMPQTLMEQAYGASLTLTEV